MMSQQKKVFFVHLPSAGGTTFWMALKAVYGTSHVKRVVKDEAKLIEQNSAIEAAINNSELTVIGGHIPYSLISQRNLDHQFITLLRNPVERAVSIYSRKVRNKKWIPDPKRGGHDIVDFTLLKGKCTGIPHYFSTLNPKFNRTDLVAETISYTPDEIIETLENRFTSFGILEHYNRSLLLFQHALGWSKPPDYVARNIGGNKPTQLSNKVILELEEILHLDMEVYRYALALFETRWNQSGLGNNPSQLNDYNSKIQHLQERLISQNNGINPYVKIAQ